MPLHLIDNLTAVLLAHVLLVFEAHLLEAVLLADMRGVGRHARVGRDAALARIIPRLDLLRRAITEVVALSAVLVHISRGKLSFCVLALAG